MKLFDSSILVFVTHIIVNVADSKLKRPRGVSIAKASLYPFSDNFVCFDGSATISFENINDNYCDCPDGSDEPGTSACPNGTFDCINTGYQSMSIPSSRVNDGICDCCDGSDEYSSKAHCVNRCFDIAKRLRDEVQTLHQQQQNLHELYQEYSRKGQDLKKDRLQKMETLTKDKEELEQVQAQLKNVKDEAEKHEEETVQMHTVLSQGPSLEDECITDSTATSESLVTTSTDCSRSLAVEQGDGTSDDLISVTELQDRETEVMKPPAESTSTSESMQSMKQTMETVDDMQIIDVTEEQAVKQTGEQAVTQTGEQAVTWKEEPMTTEREEQEVGDTDKLSETQTEECREKQESLQYSEETLQVIEAAERARRQLQDVSLKLLNVVAEFHHCQRFLATDFGPASEFATLSLQCYEFSDMSYIYSLCPFDRVTQRSKSTRMSIMLGKWSQWNNTSERKYRQMDYQYGETCEDGQHRSTVVNIECGLTDAVTAVSESTQCVYEMMFTSPAACSQAPARITADPVYDEL